MIISKKMSAAPYLCCRHHAHDGQGNSNNRSKATLQGMALPSRFLSVPPLNPQRTNFNFEPIVSPHRFAISFSGGYCIQSYNWGQKNKKCSFARSVSVRFLGKKKSPAAMQGFSNEVIREEENNLV